MSEYPKVVAHWDDNYGGANGWFVEVIDEYGNIVCDSMKVRFPLEVGGFERNEEKALAEALAEAYPDHEIYVEQQEAR